MGFMVFIRVRNIMIFRDVDFNFREIDENFLEEEVVVCKVGFISFF